MAALNSNRFSSSIPKYNSHSHSQIVPDTPSNKRKKDHTLLNAEYDEPYPLYSLALMTENNFAS